MPMSCPRLFVWLCMLMSEVQFLCSIKYGFLVKHMPSRPYFRNGHSAFYFYHEPFCRSVFYISRLYKPHFSSFRLWLNPNLFVLFLGVLRDPGPVGGAAEMSGPADRDEGPAAAGPPGLLQEEGRD